MYKKVLGLVSVIVTTSLIFSACGSKTETTSNQSQTKAEPVSMKLGHSYAATHPFNKALEEAAKKIKEKSNGQLDITVSPASQLGAENVLADGVSSGTIDMGVVGPGELGKKYKPVLIFDGPFIFRDADHALKVANGDLGKELWGGLAKASNIKVLSTLYYGTRFVTTTDKEIKTPDDLKGLKLRVPNQPMSLANAKAMGATPTPMALGEVYNALGKKDVDGQENPIATIMSNKFNEVQKYVMLTGHVIQVTPVVISQKKFDSLSEDMKKVLVDTISEAAQTLNQQMKADESKLLQDFASSKAGNKVVEVDKEAFKKATQSVIKENEASWGQGLYEKIQNVK